MFDRVQFKATGKANFKAHYWPFVAVSVLLALVSGSLINTNISVQDVENLTYMANNLDSETAAQMAYMAQHLMVFLASFAVIGGIIGFAITLLVANPFEVGACRFFLENTTFSEAPFGRVSVGFTANYGNVVLTQFLRSLYTFLWSLLLIVPGIVRSLGYFAVPYILAENPNLDHKRVLELSRQMTMGYKGDIFVTMLSFFGWYLLCGLTLGILNIFYVNPYVNGTNAEVYRFLRAKALENGLTNTLELPGKGSL